MKYLIILSILLIFYFLYFSTLPKISSDKAKKMIREGKIDYIIDVRTLEEWDEGHHPNAIHIPIGTYPKNINKKSRILIYCRTGRRAKIAVQQYIKKGYKNINYITGNYKSLL
jgi:phage shock protein E